MKILPKVTSDTSLYFIDGDGSGYKFGFGYAFNVGDGSGHGYPWGDGYGLYPINLLIIKVV